MANNVKYLYRITLDNNDAQSEEEKNNGICFVQLPSNYPDPITDPAGGGADIKKILTRYKVTDDGSKKTADDKDKTVISVERFPREQLLVVVNDLMNNAKNLNAGSIALRTALEDINNKNNIDLPIVTINNGVDGGVTDEILNAVTNNAGLIEHQGGFSMKSLTGKLFGSKKSKRRFSKRSFKKSKRSIRKHRSTRRR
jgi:hypothetical protein